MPSSLLLKKITVITKITGELDDYELKINTDSRKFNHGETFVALSGENFDGRQYIENVLQIGARAIVFVNDREYDNKLMDWLVRYPDVCFIAVTDTLKFLQSLASEHILEWKSLSKSKKVIGITGSNGKTTHKEMMSHILKGLFPEKVLATQGNFNNHIGVPLTIFNLTPDHDLAIIEMGMNHVGEIAELTAIAHPEHGMITNIGPAHIEFMKSIDNIFQEKTELYRSALKNTEGKGIFVVNADDIYLARLENLPGIRTYGEEHGEVKVNISGQEVSLNFGHNKILSFKNQHISEHHNVKNLAGVALFCMTLFPEKEQEILTLASQYTQPSMNRSQWIENIFLDAYNANPASMRTSLHSFVEAMKTKNISLDDCYFILGDMNELGEFAPSLHAEIANYVLELGIKNVTFIGRFREHYLRSFPLAISHHLVKEDFYNEWKEARKKFKFVFIKASRSLQLESLIGIV